MAPIDQAIIQSFIQAGANAATNHDRGRSLEDLVCYLFELVPGVSVTRRNALNAFETEEIDVAFWNEGNADGFPFLPTIILVECKNWSNAVSSIEVAWFDRKLADRGLDFGILVAANGITGNHIELTRSHSLVAGALAQKRRFLVLSVTEITALPDTTCLIRLLKEKLCDLAVSGTIM